MYTFEVWVRLPDYRTAHVHITASDWDTVKRLAEAQYGVGNVLNTRMI